VDGVIVSRDLDDDRVGCVVAVARPVGRVDERAGTEVVIGMFPWRPPSIRENPEQWADFDALHEGIPYWLVDQLSTWLRNNYLHKAQNGRRAIEEVSLRLRRTWTTQSFDDLHSLLVSDPDLAIDVIDGVLYFSDSEQSPRGTFSAPALQLELILHGGGSAWTAGTGAGGRASLLRRVDETTEAAAEAAMSTGGRAAEHLRTAWSKLYGMQPDPDGAYLAAVKAVEVAGASIISPRNASPTLGTMRADIENKPEKWTTHLDYGKDIEEGVLGMVTVLWRGQYRHGDESKPISHNPKDAEVAVHLAVTLVHLFQSGAITPFQTP
jgi:hypothetical protein